MDEVGELVERLDRIGFALHRLCIDREHPDILIGTYHWGHKVDVVIVIDERHAHAYRVSTWLGEDVLAPKRVSGTKGQAPCRRCARCCRCPHLVTRRRRRGRSTRRTDPAN